MIRDLTACARANLKLFVSTSPEQRNASAADALLIMLVGQARWKGGIGGRGCSGRTSTLASRVLKARGQADKKRTRLEKMFRSVLLPQ